MKWTTATALFLAIAAGGVGVTAVLNRKPMDPDEVLAEIRRESEGPAFDRDSAVERLARALEDPSVLSDLELETRLRQTRAEIYRDLSLFAEARADLEILQSSASEPDSEMELEIIKLMSLDGQREAALSRVRTLTSTGSDFGEGWAMRAQLEVESAEAALDAAIDEADSNLASSDSERIHGVIAELASRTADDPKRGALLTQLSRAFYGGSEATSSTILSQLTPARLSFKLARQNFANALNFLARPDVVVSLGQLLERAGQVELSVKLHRAARNLPEVARDPDVVAAFLEQLLATNRISEGVRVLSSWDYKLGGTLEFYRSAGEVFYRAEEYSAMRKASDGLRDYGGDLGRDWWRFYSAVPYIAQATRAKNHNVNRDFSPAMPDQISRLKAFAKEDDSPEPFFGARSLAWFWLADAHAYLGDDVGEKFMLKEALAKMPSRSSDDWVRLAQLLKKEKKVVWRQIEDAYSRALNLDPTRTAELEPDWYEAGNELLKARGETVDDLIGQLQRGGFSALNPASIGPSVMTQIAGHELAIGELYGAIRAAESAREKYRNLVPPLDIIIRAKLANTQTRAPKDAIIERIEAAGIDDQVESFMSQLPDGRLDGAELVRAIRAAPLRFGKTAVARYHLSLDDPGRAADALVDLADAAAPPELKLLRARLLVESTEYTKALGELSGLEKDPRLRSEALLLKLDALIGAEQLDRLDPVAAQMRSHPTPETKAEAASILNAQLVAVDRLASSGRLDLALKNIDVLDTGAETRTPAFYRRRVLIDAFTLDTRGRATAQESILRAEPYLRDGTPEMTAIVLAVAEREWTLLPDLVDRLLESEFRPNRYQKAALSLLGERLQSGTRAAGDGLERSPRDPDWAFLSTIAASLVDARIRLPEWFGPDASRDAQKLLRGRVDGSPKDPRDAIVLYLMSSRMEWSPWVIPRISEIADETGSSLWTEWLYGRVLEATGKRVASVASANKLTEGHPRFGPGHDLAVRLAERRHPTEPLHPQVARARRIRLQSLGEELIADPIEIRLARAGELARKGKNVEAILELAPVVNSGGIAATEGRLTLGLLMLKAGQYSGAVEQLEAALLSDPGVFKEVVIDSLLFAIRETIAIARGRDGTGAPQRNQLGEPRALAILEGLMRQYPLDPMVALTHLELLPSLSPGERGIKGGKVLDRLYQDSGRKPLDQLRRGCTRRWIEFLAPIAPDVAEAVLERDLVLEPGNLDLWQLSGEIAEIQNDRKNSKGFYETLMAIDSRPETAFALAEIMIEEGAEPREAKKILARASRAQAGGSARAIYLQTVADLRDRLLDFPAKRTPKLVTIVPRLRELWKSRERVRKEVDPLDLGLLYADALFRRLSAIELEAEKAKAAREKETAEAAIETDADREDAAKRVTSYKSRLADLQTLLVELKDVADLDTSAYYEQDLVKAMQGILKSIEARDPSASLRSN
jgi:hypothetical protein